MKPGITPKTLGTGPSVQALLEKAFEVACWPRFRPGQGFEIHPVITWPLPGGSFGCQIMGLPPVVRNKLKLPGDQGGIESICSDPVHRDELLQRLFIDIRYRLGGCWYMAQATEPGTTLEGAHLQRLQVLAQLRVASMEWSDLYDHLRAGTALVLPTSGLERQKVTPTGPGEPMVAEKWKGLAQSSMTLWMEGFLHSGSMKGAAGRSVLATAVCREESANSDNGGSTIEVMVPPICIAMAVGLRARINHHARCRMEKREAVAWVAKSVWSMLDPGRRLALHFLSAAGSDGDLGQAFAHLEDPWLASSVLGAQTTRMSPNNRKNIRKRLAKAAEEVAETFAQGVLADYILKVSKPFRPVVAKVGETPTTSESTQPSTTEGAAQRSPEGGLETTPLPGEPSPESLRKHTSVLTDPPPIPYGLTPHPAWIHTLKNRFSSMITRVLAAIRKKESRKNIGPATPSGAPWWMRGIRWIGVYTNISKMDLQGTRASGLSTNPTLLPPGTDPNDQSHDMASPRTAGFIPRDGVEYQIPGSCAPCGDPYLLPPGSKRAATEADILIIDRFLAQHPGVVSKISREAILRVVSYQPAHDASSVTAQDVVFALQNAVAGLADKQIDGLLRLIDQTPDDLLKRKAQHLLMAFGSMVLAKAWLFWRDNQEALRDWKSFQSCDPYRVAAGIAWKGIVPLTYNLENAAMAYADWWVAVHLPGEAKETSGKDPAIEALRRLVTSIRSAHSVQEWHAMLSSIQYAENHPFSSTRFVPLFRELRLDPSAILASPSAPAGKARAS